MRGMVIDMNDEQLDTLAQLRAFLDGTAAVDFAVAADERYDFIARTVRRFGYRHLKRADKGVVLRFLERDSGYSRIYTSADLRLSAHTDTLHGTLSGLATKKLMERAYGVFGDARQVWTKTR